MTSISYAAVVFSILFGIYFFFQKPPSSPSYDALPIVGLQPHVFGRLAAAIRYILHAEDFFKEGYHKYPAGFRLPELFSRYLVVLPASLVEELKGATDTDLSQPEALELEVAVSKVLYSASIVAKPFHVAILRGALARRLGDLLGGLEEETSLAFEEEWGPDIRGGEWTEINAFNMAENITARSGHRIVMGLPLCKSDISSSSIPSLCVLAASAFYLGHP